MTASRPSRPALATLLALAGVTLGGWGGFGERRASNFT